MADNGTTRNDEDIVDATPERPAPAASPVIETRPLDAGDQPDVTNDEAHPPIESALLGQGEGQAAHRRDDFAPEDGIEDAVMVEETLAPERPRDPAAASPPRSPAAPVTVERRGGFWPMVLGGIVAAGLGAGAAWWAAPRTDGVAPAATVDTAALSDAAVASGAAAARAEIEAERPALIDAAREAARAAVAEAPATAADPDLSDRLAAVEARLEAQPGGASVDGEAEGRLAQIEARVDRIAEALATPALIAPPDAPPLPVVRPDEIAALRDGLAAQAARIEELAARPVIEPAVAEDLRRMASAASETGARIEALAAEVEARLAEARKAAADLAAQNDRIAAEVAETARRAEAAAAVARLQSTLASGGDTGEAVAALQAAGADAVDIPAEVPSLEALQAGWDEAARAGLAAARETAGTEAAGGGIAGFLRAQTGARSVTPRAGDDADAVLSRAGAAVAEGRIDAALTELAALPEAARDAMSDWIAGAQARVRAEAAVTRLQTQP